MNTEIYRKLAQFTDSKLTYCYTIINFYIVIDNSSAPEAFYSGGCCKQFWLVLNVFKNNLNAYFCYICVFRTCMFGEMSSSGSTNSSQSMMVVVRVRGENEKERSSQLPVIAKVVDEKVIVFDPKIQTSPEYHRGRKRSFRDMTKRINRNVFFAFDLVFDETTSNLEVFSYTTEAIVTDVINGYNACGGCLSFIYSHMKAD